MIDRTGSLARVDLVTFLQKEEDWYDPRELIQDHYFLPAHDVNPARKPNTIYDFLGIYNGLTYVVDPRDGYAKPLRELR